MFDPVAGVPWQLFVFEMWNVLICASTPATVFPSLGPVSRPLVWPQHRVRQLYEVSRPEQLSSSQR